jgi:hypothetical protein
MTLFASMLISARFAAGECAIKDLETSSFRSRFAKGA